MNPLWNEILTGSELTLQPAQIRQIEQYLDGLIDINRTLNLTRITDRAAAEIKHVADALTLLPLVPKVAKTLVDVGTGGGIPGVILAIARPDLAVTLIDSTRKKLDAVQTICNTIGITNVRTVHGRIEAVQLKFDVVTARAVAELDTLLGWCRGLMKPKSIVLAMKGPRVGEELAALTATQRRDWDLSVHQVSVEALAGHNIVQARLRK